MSTMVTPEPGYDGFAKEEHHHDYAGDTLLGFWIYIMSDCILFATLFAAYARSQHQLCWWFNAT